MKTFNIFMASTNFDVDTDDIRATRWKSVQLNPAI